MELRQNFHPKVKEQIDEPLGDYLNETVEPAKEPRVSKPDDNVCLACEG